MQLEDFYAEVLSKLGVLAAEEAPSAADRKAVEDKYTQIHAEYFRREIISWPDAVEVPDWAADAFATIVADRLQNKFSLSDQDSVFLRADAQMAQSMIVADGQNQEKAQTSDIYY